MMSLFSQLLKDRVSIVKADGTRTENLPANVTSTSISIHGSEPLIEPGDLVIRKASNGAEETFRVIDPNFREAFHAIPARYEMKVQKLGIAEAKSAVQSITYNVTGNNARINHHSVDNSTNVVTADNDVQEALATLRREVEALNIPDSERQAALEIVDAVDEQFSVGKPKRSVVAALLAGLPQVANIATVVSAIATFVQ